MAELATIARPYAEALFKASRTDLSATSAWLEELSAIAADSQMQAFADNPNTNAAQVVELVKGVIKAPLGQQGVNFVTEVVVNGKLKALPEMAAQFRALVNANSGVADATVYSAFPMDAAALSGVSGSLEKRFGRKLNLRVELDAELIGGVRVVVGDEVLDTSVKARLEHMKSALMA
jgi:F-type H+-transporting ATPase subunit delta